MIKDRPKELLNIEFYTSIPKTNVKFDYAVLPPYLNFDLFNFIGIQPKTRDLLNEGVFGFLPNPSEIEIEFYRKNNTKFQMINVVANMHTFKSETDDVVLAHPYSISLIPGQKRGLPQECDINLLAGMDIEEVSQRGYIYTDYSPFKPVDQGFFTHISFLGGNESTIYTDTIGFVLETYFLPINIDLDTAVIGQLNTDNDIINAKYRKHRIKRYFRPFEKIIPRKIWGCDSPIELFLIQALASKNIFPIIQTMIFKNGSIYDNFYKMIEDDVFIKGNELITEADLYFPDKKIAIFCDSKKFHRGSKNKLKDEKIDIELAKNGIKTLRLSGKEIMDNLDKCVHKVERILK